MQGRRIDSREDGEYQAWIEKDYPVVFILNTIINHEGVILEHAVKASYRDVTSDSC